MAATTARPPFDFIHTATLDNPATEAALGTTSAPFTTHPILPNEIAHLDVFASTFHSAPHTVHPLPDPSAVARLFLFYRGSGAVECGGQRYAVDDMALLVAHPTSPLLVTAVTAPLAAVELHWRLTGDEALPASLPYFQAYATARTYKEAIKSPRTTSRTLLPAGLIPRLAMGSVQTEGPDAVAAHRHPMLEQLFVGVRGCDCVVECDGLGVGMLEGEVVHIPLGSEHGVRVEAGKLLEYIWMDFFLNQQDGDRWISTMHTDDPV